MPNEDGVGFLRLAKQLGYRKRIIVISGERPEILKGAERLAHMYGLQCIGAYRKPFHPALMLDVLLKEQPEASELKVDTSANETVKLREVHYQPRIDLETERCVGAEALSRFCNSFGHPLNTEHAIMTAEKTGAIEELTWSMIDQVLVDARQLRDTLGYMFNLSFNISSAVASRHGFAGELKNRVEAAGLKTSSFTVELTETQLSQNMAQCLENLTKLRIADFGLALDDFGTGHANIDQLASFPFTELKVDKRFVMRAEKDRFAETCVDAAVNIAKAMNLRVIAEGIEDEWAFDFVRKLAVEEGQGYLFSKAVPVSELADFVQWTHQNV